MVSYCMICYYGGWLFVFVGVFVCCCWVVLLACLFCFFLWCVITRLLCFGDVWWLGVGWFGVGLGGLVLALCCWFCFVGFDFVVSGFWFWV